MRPLFCFAVTKVFQQGRGAGEWGVPKGQLIFFLPKQKMGGEKKKKKQPGGKNLVTRGEKKLGKKVWESFSVPNTSTGGGKPSG